MELYVQISFCFNVIALLLNVVALCHLEWPRTETKTVGKQIFIMIIGALFTIWGALVLFGN